MRSSLLKMNKLILIFFAIGAFLITGCSDSATSVPSMKPVNNFIININEDSLFANACTIGEIIIDSEAIPEGTIVDVDFVPGFNSVGTCLLDSSTVIDSSGRAFLDFITDYVVGVGSVGSFRILLSATTPDGQEITQFANVFVSGIGITPPTDDNGSSTFTLDITDDGMMTEIPFLVLQFSTTGIKPGTEVDFTLSNGLGSVDVNPAVVVGSVNSGAFTTTYFPEVLAGTQFLTATITLDTPQEILDECDVVSESIEISVVVTIVQSVMAGGDDGMDGM